MLSLLAIYPFSVATLKLQSDCTGNYAKPQFNSIPDLFDKIYKIEGLEGFYRGIGVSICGIAVYRGSYFALAGLFANIREKGFNDVIMHFSVHQLIAIFAGIISYPLLVLRDRVQVHVGWEGIDRKFKTASQCLDYILEKQGIRGLFRGLPFTLATGIIGAILLSGPLQFMLKESRKK